MCMQMNFVPYIGAHIRIKMKGICEKNILRTYVLRFSI